MNEPPSSLPGVAAPTPGSAVGEDHVRYAGFWIRTFAFLVDGILLSIAAALIHWFIRMIFGAEGANASTIRLISNLISSVVSIAYFTISWHSPGQATAGQLICGLRVISRSGEVFTWAHALGRYFALCLALLPAFLGVLIIPFTARRQGLHDLLARTYVVKI